MLFSFFFPRSDGVCSARRICAEVGADDSRHDGVQVQRFAPLHLCKGACKAGDIPVDKKFWYCMGLNFLVHYLSLKE